MGLKQRMPDWNREDGILNVFHIEEDKRKLISFNNLLRRYVEQPVKIWASHKTEKIVGTNDLLNNGTTFNIEIDKCYPIMPSFTFEDTTFCTPPNAITGPITITSGDKRLIIDTNLPAGSKLEITPEKILLDGIDISLNPKLSQEDNSNSVSFGKTSGNKELKQYFTPNYDTNLIEIMVGSPMGYPSSDILCEFREVNGDNENYLETFTISNTALDQYQYEPFKTMIPLSNTLEANKQYVILFRMSEIYNNDNYFTMQCSATKNFSAGDLYALQFNEKDEEVWVKQSFDVYFKTYIPRTFGDYPVLSPEASSISIGFQNIVEKETCVPCIDPDDSDYAEEIAIPNTVMLTYEFDKVSLDQLHAKALADKLYPLKAFRLYKDDGSLIKGMKFIKEKKYVCYRMDIPAVDIDFHSLPQKFYVEVEWHFFDAVKKVGFPVSYAETDVKYKPNKALDVHAKDFSMFRQKYCTVVPYYKYAYTFPVGYPFEYEQDYWLEKRLSEEYTTRIEASNESEVGTNNSVILEDALDYEEDIPKDEIEPSNAIIDNNVFVNTVYIKDSNGNRIIKLDSDKPGLHNITISTYTDGTQDILALEETTLEKEYISEVYYFDEIRKFIRKINRESKLVTATYLNNPENGLCYEVQYLLTEGTYKRFGLIKSELYGYLGRIPQIKNMWEYIVFLDREDWDSKYWSGDLYVPGVFRADIPWPLPANFCVLTNDEINTILKKCKKLGTEGISSYAIKSGDLYLGNLSVNADDPTGVYEKEFDLKMKASAGEEGICKLQMGASVSYMEADMSLPEMKLNLKQNISVSSYVTALDAYTKDHFSNFAFNNIKTDSIGSKNILKIDTGVKSISNIANRAYSSNRDGGRHINSCYIHGHDDEIKWKNFGAINGAGAVKTIVSDATSYAETELLVMDNFNITNDIPDDCIITGLQVDLYIKTERSNLQKYGGSTFTCGTGGTCNCGERPASGPVINLNINTGGAYNSDYDNMYAANGSYIYKRKANASDEARIVSFGGPDDTWGKKLTKDTLGKLKVLMFMGHGMTNPEWHVRRDKEVAVAWCKVNVFFRQKTASIQTNRIKAIKDGSNSRWTKFQHSLAENVPKSCKLNYEIIKERIVFQQTTSNSYTSFGVADSKSIFQITKPGISSISGVTLYSSGVVGNPTDDVRISLCTLNPDLSPNEILDSFIVYDWSTGAKEINLDVRGLNTNHSYGILVERTGKLDNSNYYKISTAQNPEKTIVMVNGYVFWKKENNFALMHKIYTPYVIKSNLSSPDDLHGLEYSDIKIRGYLSTSNLYYSPKISRFRVFREAFYND